jgi:hypothetical protein
MKTSSVSHGIAPELKLNYFDLVLHAHKKPHSINGMVSAAQIRIAFFYVTNAASKRRVSGRLDLRCYVLQLKQVQPYLHKDLFDLGQLQTLLPAHH